MQRKQHDMNKSWHFVFSSLLRVRWYLQHWSTQYFAGGSLATCSTH